MLDPFGHQPPSDEPYELTPVEPKCPQCDYDLRGITSIAGARCPECGSRLSFDKLKFKRDREALARFRYTRPLRYIAPVFWSPSECAVVILIIGISTYLMFKFGDPKKMSIIGLAIVIIGELVLAHWFIVARRYWRLHFYDERRRKRSM